MYVAGYGRSGSTLLDMILGLHPTIASLGEAGRIWDLADVAAIECSCGQRLCDCPRWSEVARSIDARVNVVALRREAKPLERLLFGWFRRGDLAPLDYRFGHRALVESIGESWQATHVVDSSKTAYDFAWRPLALHRHCDLDVRLIHLVRNPSAVVASCLKGRNRALAGGEGRARRFEVAITLAGWNFANAAAVANGRILGDSRYLRIDFDELRCQPRRTMEVIGSFLELDMTGPIAHVAAKKPLLQAHLIGGNRVARSAEVVVESGDRDDKANLGALTRLAVHALADPVYRTLGRA